MARIPRSYLLQDHSYFHITWKCHNNDFLLGSSAAKVELARLLKKYKSPFGVKIYGICLMNNHPHIVGQCASVKDLSAYFRIVNGLFARFINRLMNRRGQVVMDRFRSPQIESEKHLLAALRYVDLNPVRAGICKRISSYRFSACSARTSAGPLAALLDPLPDFFIFSPSDYEIFSDVILRRVQRTLPSLTQTFFIGSFPWVHRKKERLKDLRTRRSKPKSIFASL